MRKSDFKVYATKTDCVIKKYTGKESTVEVPAFFQINGVDRPVTKIAAKAFRNCQCLRKVVLPDSIKVIDEDAFSGCYDLEELNLPKELEYVSKNAFEYTDLRLGFLLADHGKKCYGWIGNNSDSHQYLVVPEGVEEICENAFMHNKVKHLILPQSLKKIAYMSIYCDLDEIVIPEGVTEIEDYAFCGNIKNIYISEKSPAFSSLVQFSCARRYSSTYNDLSTVSTYVYNNGRLQVVTAEDDEKLKAKLSSIKNGAMQGDPAAAKQAAKKLQAAERVFALLDWQTAEMQYGYSYPLVGADQQIYLFERYQQAKKYIESNDIKGFYNVPLIGSLESADEFTNVANLLKMAQANGIEKVFYNGDTVFPIADLLQGMDVGNADSFNINQSGQLSDGATVRFNPVGVYCFSGLKNDELEAYKQNAVKDLFNPCATNAEDLLHYLDQYPLNLLCYAHTLLHFKYLPAACQKGDQLLEDYFSTMKTYYGNAIINRLQDIGRIYVLCDKKTRKLYEHEIEGERFIYLTYTDLFSNKSPYGYIPFQCVNDISQLISQNAYDGFIVTDGIGEVALLGRDEKGKNCLSRNIGNAVLSMFK